MSQPHSFVRDGVPVRRLVSKVSCCQPWWQVQSPAFPWWREPTSTGYGVSTPVYVHAQARTNTHTPIHTYTYTHIHTHRYILTYKQYLKFLERKTKNKIKVLMFCQPLRLSPWTESLHSLLIFVYLFIKTAIELRISYMIGNALSLSCILSSGLAGVFDDTKCPLSRHQKA